MIEHGYYVGYDVAKTVEKDSPMIAIIKTNVDLKKPHFNL